MIAMLSAPSLSMSPLADPFPRTSNTAGAPLPGIPRRSASSSRTLSMSEKPNTPSKLASPTIQVQQATPPENDKPTFPSTSSLARPIVLLPSAKTHKSTTVRPKSERVIRALRNPPEPSSPTPLSSQAKKDSFQSLLSTPADVKSTLPASSMASPLPLKPPLMYTAGVPLRVGRPSFPDSRSEMGAPVKPSIDIPPMVRKKSGQLVKSSLKSTKTPVRGSLSVITGSSTSKSEPTTPSGKAVHFDAHLEHVKLFLSEQKPLAVSRDGSPTDTSGTESDFPTFIYGESLDEKRSRQQQLVMQVTNLPSQINMAADLALEKLELDSDATNILGRVRVRNIAFQKWLAVRFTFDAWQTTSEVTGKYLETMDPNFDIFTFSIRLNDLLARIERKTLNLALRYAVAGREIWDNNNGQNYVATFSKTAPKSRVEVKEAVDPAFTDLRSRLENVVKDRDEESSSVPSSTWRTKDSLSSRYDFAASLKQPFIFNLHARTSPSESSNSVPWPPKVLSPPGTVKIAQHKPSMGSPRETDDNSFRPAFVSASDVEDPPFSALLSTTSHIRRKHHRGYFDMDTMGGAPKKTPPGTPTMTSMQLTALVSPRFNSFPPLASAVLAPGFSIARDTGSSDESTPVSLSPTASSRSPSPSPIEQFDSSSVDPHGSYSQFLDKFCFFTGHHQLGASASSSSSESSRKSSVDDLSTATYPFLIGSPTETRDDSVIHSGSTTPTSRFVEPSASVLL